MLNHKGSLLLTRFLLAPMACIVVSSTAAIGATCAADSTGATDAQPAIQACLDGGDIVSLVAGGTYLIGSPLRLTRPGTIFTSDGASRAILRASPTLEGGILIGETPIAWPTSTVERISFVGRKIYGHNRFSLSNPDDCGGLGTSVVLNGLFLVNDVESSQAICGTALSMEGAFVVENSFIHDNGWDTNMSWADGITVQGCTEFGAYRGEVRNNRVENNTDIGVIAGGGPCQVYSNQISQTNTHAFAGLMVGWFPGGGGNHGGANYYNNTITSALNGMAFGIMVGNEAWFNEAHGYTDYVSNAGSVTGNSISGAVVNLAIEGIGTGSILGNTIGINQGSNGFGCTATMPYSAHMFGTATIQGGWHPFWFFAGRCGSWNPSLPAPDHPGSLAHGRRLLPFTEIHSSPAGNYTLAYQNDGNLVLYDNSTHEAVWWQPGPVGSPTVAIMQEDANFVVYSAIVWSTNTSNWDNRGAYFVVQDDGNLVVYRLDGGILWHRFQ